MHDKRKPCQQITSLYPDIGPAPSKPGEEFVATAVACFYGFTVEELDTVLERVRGLVRPVRQPDETEDLVEAARVII